MGSREAVVVEVKDFEAETEKAVLVKDTTLHSAWVPKSQISYRRREKGNKGVIEIPMWLADKLELDYEQKD